MNKIFYPTPRHIEYWVTSDGRSWGSLKEAEEHEKMIHSANYQESMANVSHKTFNLNDHIFWEG